jgi:hypothetical protein
MSTVFDTLYETAMAAYADLFGGTVTLSRGSDSTVGVAASWISQGSAIQTQTHTGVKTSSIDREWLIVKADYVINGVVVTPVAGDRLVDVDGVTWEVMGWSNVPAAESYGSGLEWIVRTKRIAVT